MIKESTDTIDSSQEFILLCPSMITTVVEQRGVFVVCLFFDIDHLEAFLFLFVRASRRERETRRPESDVTGMSRNAPSRLPLRNRNTSGEIGYDYSHFGEEDPHARLPKPRPDS